MGLDVVEKQVSENYMEVVVVVQNSSLGEAAAAAFSKAARLQVLVLTTRIGRPFLATDHGHSTLQRLFGGMLEKVSHKLSFSDSPNLRAEHP